MKINTHSSTVTTAIVAVLCLLGIVLSISDKPVNAKANSVKAPFRGGSPMA